MGAGAGIFAGLLGGFAGRQLEDEDRIYKEKLAQNEQKRRIFTELIGNPNLSEEARSVALQGIVSMSRERPIAKGGKQKPNESDAIFDQLLQLPPTSQAGRPETTLPPMPQATATGTLATPGTEGGIPVKSTAPQGSLGVELPAIPSKPGIFMSPEEQATRQATGIYATGRAQARARADVESETQADEIERLVRAGMPRAEATERVIMGKYPPRPAGFQAKVIEIPDPNDSSKTIRVWANYNPLTGSYEPTSNAAPSSTASQSQFYRYFAATKAKNPNMTDDDIVRQYNVEMASGRVVPTTTTTEIEEAPGVVRRSTATKSKAGGGAGGTRVLPQVPTSGEVGAPTTTPIVPRLDASTVQLGRTAHSIRPHIPEIIALAQKLENEGKLGPMGGRWQDFLAGRYGSGDEDFARLRSLVSMFTTGTMRAHVGARGGQGLLAKFTSLADASKMDLPTLRGALSGIDSFLKTYEDQVMNPRGTQSQISTPPPPSKTGVKTAEDLKAKYGLK